MILTCWDRFLIIGLVIVALSCLGIVRYMADGPDMVIVQVDGEEVVRQPLSDDRRLSVQGPLGRTEIEIKDERVRVVDSPCNRKICVKTGWIDRSYQTIVCAPNRIVIRLLSRKDADKLDGITG